ncbi:MAG TPA: branched-chain amino acid ABC transporter permease [Firmicutes bacterium]|nr:branched-chain amino acid ABC transporter permease [Bacillota bacterium]
MPKAGASKAKRNAVMVFVAASIYGIIQLLAFSGTLLSYHLQILSLACINIILVMSLNLITGFTGQFSLGHAGFMAIGAYLSAALTVFYQIPFFVALILSGIAAALVGVIIGLPALRLRGDYLAIATLGFGEIIRVVILNIPAVGGPRGFTGIPRYTTFGLTYVLMIITILVLRNFIDSSHGRACISIREDETAAASLGINTTYYKVTAFALGAGFAGVAGGLFSHYMQYISPAPGQIGFLRSIDILIMVVLGGLGNITGSIISAIVLTLLPEFLRGFAEYRMVIYSVLLIVMMLFRPEGIMGKNELSLEALENLVGRVKNRKKGMRPDGTS